MYHIQVFNLSRSKVFALPSEYCDWTEACMEGQKYIFNRQEENNEALFFRVVDNCDFIPEEEEKEETNSCNGVCFACPEDQENCFQCPKFSQCWEEEEEETPRPEELTCGIDCDRCSDAWECDDAFYMDRKSIDRDDIDSSHSEPEEPSSDSLAEILSEFNAIRPNY